MSGPSSFTGGVKPFSIAGRVSNMRERLMGMTEDERRWRAQWLKDQELSPEEPKFVPEYYKTTNNIFRRIWRFPGDQYEKLLTPFLGKEIANFVRLCSATSIKFIASVYILTYVLKYHSNDFTTFRNAEIWQCRPRMYSDEPGFPNFYKKTAQDFYDMGFYSSVLCVDVPPPPPPPPPPPVELPEACGPTDSTQ